MSKFNHKNKPLSKAARAAQLERMIDLGLQQIKEGKTMTHEEARKKIKAHLKKKS